MPKISKISTITLNAKNYEIVNNHLKGQKSRKMPKIMENSENHKKCRKSPKMSNITKNLPKIKENSKNHRKCQKSRNMPNGTKNAKNHGRCRKSQKTKITLHFSVSVDCISLRFQHSLRAACLINSQQHQTRSW